MVRSQTLADLIAVRSRELGLNKRALGHRIGYSNPDKAAGLVKALSQGHIQSRKSRAALDRLAPALEVPDQSVKQTVEATERMIAEDHRQHLEQERLAEAAAEAIWRANFKPHAVIDTEQKRPSSISMCGITGGSTRWLVIRLDASQEPDSFVEQVIATLPGMLRTDGAGEKTVVFYGKALGFIINYSPDHAVRFDLFGAPLETLSKAYRPGQVSFG